MGARRRLRSALLLLLLALVLPAGAWGDPLGDWRAGWDRLPVDGGGAVARAYAAAHPAFARAWLYATALDLEAAPADPRMRLVADLLAELEPPDLDAELLVDGAERAALGALQQGARHLDDALGVAGEQAQRAARLAPSETPTLARPLFYQLLIRASSARERLGADAERARLLRIARHLAEGFALGPGEMAPWQALAALEAAPTVSLRGAGGLGRRIGEALNARLEADLRGARRLLGAALEQARRARRRSTLVALLMNGVANAEGWLNRPRVEIAQRLQVLQALRPLGAPARVALAGSQLIGALLQAGEVDALIPYARELRQLGAAAQASPMTARALSNAAEAMGREGRARAARHEARAADPLLKEAGAALSSLVEPRALQSATPAAARGALSARRQRARARLALLRARLAGEQGALDDERARLEEARRIYREGLPEAHEIWRVQAALARNALARAEPDEALTWTARATEQTQQDAAARAEIYRVQGWARLARGDWPEAFANANAGLEVVRAANVQEEFRGRRAALHLLAAASLEGAGHRAEALRRYAYAGRLALQDPGVMRVVAQARAAAGDLEGALEALPPAPPSTRRAVDRGCLLVLAHRDAEAEAALPPLRSLSAPESLGDRLRWRTCRATLQLRASALDAAAATLGPARAELLAWPEPALSWRLRALSGELARRRGEWLQAAEDLQRASLALLANLDERPARGIHAQLIPLAAPARPTGMLTAAPEIFVRAASQDRRRADHFHALAVGWDRWRRALEATEASGGAPEIGHRPRVETSLRAQVERLRRLRARLEGAHLNRTGRARTSDALARTSRRLTAGVEALHRDAGAWADFVLPRPEPAQRPAEGHASLYLRAGPGGSALWTVGARGPWRFHRLPNTPALAALLPSGSATGGPQLAAAARLILPIGAATAQAKIWDIWPTDPLWDAPWRRLVRAVAPSAPTVHLHLSAATPGARPKEPSGVGVFGPLPPGGRCPPELSCDGEGLRPPAGAAQRGGARATAAGLDALLAQSRAVIISAPITPGGAILVAPAAPDGLYGEIGGSRLAMGRGAPDMVVLSETIGQHAAEGLLASLRLRGVRALALPVSGPAAPTLGPLLEAVARGEASAPGWRVYH